MWRIVISLVLSLLLRGALGAKGPNESLVTSVVELTSDGVSTAAISEELGCSQRWVQRIVKGVCESRRLRPRPVPDPKAL